MRKIKMMILRTQEKILSKRTRRAYDLADTLGWKLVSVQTKLKQLDDLEGKS